MSQPLTNDIIPICEIYMEIFKNCIIEVTIINDIEMESILN